MAYRSLDFPPFNLNAFPGEPWSFDSSTKINICSDKNGASALSCTVSQLDLFYSSDKDIYFAMNYVGGVTRIIFV